MTSYFYNFNVADTTTGVPVPEGYPPLEAVSGSWRVLSGKAHTDTSRDQNPILAATLGAGSVDISCAVGSGGDAVYVRVQDANNWIRARTRSRTTSYTYYTTLWEWLAYIDDYSYDTYWCASPDTPCFSEAGYSFLYSTGNSVQTTNTGYSTLYEVYLEKSVAGAITVLGSASAYPSKLRVRVLGTSVQVYLNDSSSPSISANVSEFSTIAKHGIGRGPSENDSTNLDDLTIDSLNEPPYAPSPTFPTGNVRVDRTSSLTFTWAFQDPNQGDLQSAYSLRYRLVGSSTWVETGWVSSALGAHEVPSGALVDNGAYEWQVATKDATGDLGPYSSLSFFRAGTPPTAPVITAPLNGGVISVEEYPVTWTAEQQDAYQLQVLDNGVAVYDSGTIAGTSGTHTTPFPDNNVSRTVRLRVYYDGLWSNWSSVAVSVSYSPPRMPVLSVDPIDLGVGLLSAIRVVISHPTPSGTEPTVLFSDVWVREAGESGEGLRIGANVTPGNDVVWYEPAHGVSYEVRAKALGDNGTSTWSSWVPSTGPVVIHGFLLHDPSSPVDTLRWFRYNDSGAKESVSVESALTHYTGRKHPVAEFGETETRTVEVPLIQSDDYTASDWAWLRSLVLERRPVVCYRDSRGRKLFGFVTENSGSDVHYGQETSLILTATNYSEGV